MEGTAENESDRHENKEEKKLLSAEHPKSRLRDAWRKKPACICQILESMPYGGSAAIVEYFIPVVNTL